jgi:hypothetical protein
MCFPIGGPVARIPWSVRCANSEYVYQSIDGFFNLWSGIIYLLPQASKQCHLKST